MTEERREFWKRASKKAVLAELEAVEERMTRAFEELEGQMIAVRLVEKQMKRIQSMAVRYWRLWLELTTERKRDGIEQGRG